MSFCFSCNPASAHNADMQVWRGVFCNFSGDRRVFRGFSLEYPIDFTPSVPLIGSTGNPSDALCPSGCRKCR